MAVFEGTFAGDVSNFRLAIVIGRFTKLPPANEAIALPKVNSQNAANNDY